MHIYNTSEIEEDVFAFEGIVAKITVGKENIQPAHFCQLYSEWAVEPLSGNYTVSDFKAKIQLFIMECALPLISGEIPVDADYVVLAGYCDLPLDIVFSTNNEHLAQNKTGELMSPSSSYTAIAVLAAGECVSYFEKRSCA